MNKLSIITILVQFTICVYGNTKDYVIPTPEILVSENGLQVLLPDAEGMDLFYFYGRVAKTNGEVQKVTMETRNKTNGAWILHDYDIRFDIGDTITYWMYVKKNGVGYRMPYATHQVNYVIGRSTTTTEYEYITTPYNEDAEKRTTFTIRDPVNLDGTPKPVKCDAASDNQLRNLTDVIMVMQLHIESLEDMLIRVLDKINTGNVTALEVPPK